MSQKRKKLPDSKPSVPGYIVTFSDMVTLLLTFFVLLLSMAEEQNAELFREGQDSFKRALADFGLSGYLVSKSGGPQFDHPKVKYPVDEGQDKPEDRSLDPQTEVLRRTILELEKKMKITPSHIQGSDKTITVPDFRFAKGQWQLPADGEAFVESFATQLEENFTGSNLTVYVAGLAADAGSDKQQYILSARRAEAIADAIRAHKAGGSQWRVYSWGAGDGGAWTGTQGMVDRDSQVMIVTLHSKY